MNGTLRLCLAVALVLLAGQSAAMFWNSCPSGNAMYARQTCTAYKACEDKLCLCGGATTAAAGASNLCVYADKPSCTMAAGCAAKFIACVNAASSDTSCATDLADLKASQVALAAGAVYNTTAEYSACKHAACVFMNQSAADGCGTAGIPYMEICPAPFTYTGSLTLGGASWSGVVTAAQTGLIAALEADLTKRFGFGVKVHNVTVTADGLTVVFTVKGSPNNAHIKAVIAEIAASTDAAWLASTKAIYAANGGTATDVTVKGLATFVAPTPAPATPTPGPTTAAPSSASLAWSLVHVVLAAAALLLVA